MEPNVLLVAEEGKILVEHEVDKLFLNQFSWLIRTGEPSRPQSLAWEKLEIEVDSERIKKTLEEIPY